MSANEASAVIYYQIPKQTWDTIIGELQEIKQVIQENYNTQIKTVTEFSKVIGVTPKTVHLWIKQGVLEKSCVPRGIRVLSHYKEKRSHFVEYRKQ